MALLCENPVKHRDFMSFTAVFDCLDDHHERRRAWGDQQAMIATFALCRPGCSTSYDTACDDMFDWIGKRLGVKEAPSKSGLHRARSQVGVDAPRRLWNRARAWAVEHQAVIREAIPGHVLAAIDGTSFIMPRTASTSAAYGIRRKKSGEELSHYPEARMVSAWDIERRLPLAWDLAGAAAKGGERAQMRKIIDDLPQNAVVVCDAGLPSRKILGAIHAGGRHIVVRMVAAEACAWKEIGEFLNSGKKSAVVDIAIEHRGKLRTERYRLVRRTYRRGRPMNGQKRQRMVILTSLIDPTITDQQIIDIYRQRWTIETIHDELKTLSDIESWHSTTAKGIQQELLCRMLWHLLVGHISSHIEAQRQAQNPERKIRANTATVMRYVSTAVSYVMEAQSIKNRSVKKFLEEKADRQLARAMKSIVTKRARKSRPRKPFHPYARPQGIARKGYA